LNWAASTGTKTHSEWYPGFESITGVSLWAATAEDVQLFWVCKGWYQNGHCDGMETPCGRSCGSSAFTAEDGSSAANQGTNNWVWIVVGVTLTAALVLCVVLMVYVLRNNKPVVVSDDGIKLKDDQQIRGTDDRMIELEESMERMDGDMTTIEVTA